MKLAPVNLKVPTDMPPKEKRLSNINGGLNVKYFESMIKEKQSPKRKFGVKF